MSDILDVKRGLAARAQSVAEMLLPAGRKKGNEWRAGSLAGEKGNSLGVRLVGPKAGVWCDFSTKESGDLLDLWCAVRGIKLTEALDQARAFLGMEKPKAFREPTKTFMRPSKPRCSAPQGRAFDYLREDRNISAEAVAAYNVAETPDGQIIFPFLNPAGELIMGKRRKPEAGASPIPISSNFEQILFGWQAISESARTVVICEGEIDALSWRDYGYPAMSVPMGGGGGAKQQWIENDLENMERFETIYLALDNDDVGDQAAAEIAKRLGRHRCKRVIMPRKDANQCLVDGVSKEEMDSAIANAKVLDPQELRKPSTFRDKVVNLFCPTEDQHTGYRMPYQRLGNDLLFRPGELTLWTGKSGDGKSQILSDCIVDWVHQGSRVCLSSLEMRGAQTLKRMVKQAGNVDRPTEEFVNAIINWLDPGLLIYEHVGKSGVEGILEVFDYARCKYDCDMFIIDSLMRLGIAGDDYTGQEQVVFKLVEWVIKNDVHLHLVAHARKSSEHVGPAETEDVKGAMEIGANAFNIISVWRNRKREEEIERERDEKLKQELVTEKPLVVMNVAKQRNGDYEGKTGLWFDKRTYRYRSSPNKEDIGRQYVAQIGKAAA